MMNRELEKERTFAAVDAGVRVAGKLLSCAQGALFSLIAGASIFMVLCLRTTGLHLDEGGYLHYAKNIMLGDTPVSGKPFAFYVFNYVINHLLSRLAAPFVNGIYAGYFLNILATSILLALAPIFLFSQFKKRAKFFLLLLSAPLLLFNATAFMMETPIFPLCTAMFLGLWATREKLRPFRSGGFALFWAAVFFATLLKVTVIFAVLALGLPFIVIYRGEVGLKKALMFILSPIMIAIAVNTVVLFFISTAKTGVAYGASEFFKPLIILKRFRFMPSYVYTWIFFALPVAFVPLRAAWPERLSLSLGKAGRDHQWLIWVIVGSFILCIAFDPLTYFEMARYAYPTIWMGVMAAAWLLTSYDWSKILLVIIIHLLITSTLVSTYSFRFALWPSIVSKEFFYAGHNMFYGAKFHDWLMFSKNSKVPLCVYINKQGEEQNYLAKDYFSFFSPAPQFFDETSRADFDRCTLPKVYIRRAYVKDTAPTCGQVCEGFKSRWNSCVIQPIKMGLGQGDVVNETCLP